MNPQNAAFLRGQTPAAEEYAEWAEGKIKLEVKSYVSLTRPPTDLITSARAIVTRGAEVLVLRHRDRTHIIPGGRLEPGESPVEALRREIVEEAGWEIGNIQQLGFMHLHHLTPEPDDYEYPYPDFFWLIFGATAVKRVGNPVCDEHEILDGFHPIEEVDSLELRPSERVFLTESEDG